MPFLVAMRLSFVGLLCAASLCLAGPATADDLQDCIDQGNAQGIDTPTCVEQNGKYVPEDSGNGGFGGDSSDGGIPAGFIVLFVFVVILGIGLTVWRVSTARRLATDSGMDPDVATKMALLDENGLSATYLASSLRGHQLAEPEATPARASTANRLSELKSLLDSGSITQAEYDERRKAIIDSV
jgi:hypothetical protein